MSDLEIADDCASARQAEYHHEAACDRLDYRCAAERERLFHQLFSACMRAECPRLHDHIVAVAQH